MRKIEQQMLAAIQKRKDWKKDNTIAILEFNPDDSLRDYHLNHCGWKTQTTASRLRAIINYYDLPALTIKNGQWLLGESPW